MSTYSKLVQNRLPEQPLFVAGLILIAFMAINKPLLAADAKSFSGTMCFQNGFIVSDTIGVLL